MALVFRNGRPRLQHSVRRGGRVTTEYRGGGEVALLTARLESLERDERDSERSESEDERKALEAAEQPLIDYFNSVEDLTRAVLLASGFHQHKRQWRKRRGRHQER